MIQLYYYITKRIIAIINIIAFLLGILLLAVSSTGGIVIGLMDKWHEYPPGMPTYLIIGVMAGLTYMVLAIHLFRYHY